MASGSFCTSESDYSRGPPRLPLFQAPSDSTLSSPEGLGGVTSLHFMIAGINGSGKSTLIDGIMVSLLPFEGMVKLRVTHDIANGTGGGGSIRDYVLGKHSSTSGDLSNDMEKDRVFSRKTGFSAVLLVLTSKGSSAYSLPGARLVVQSIQTQGRLSLLACLWESFDWRFKATQPIGRQRKRFRPNLWKRTRVSLGHG